MRVHFRSLPPHFETMRIWPLMCMLLLGCGSPTAEPDWAATDSAGVRIVEIAAAPEALPQYATIGEANLTIGSAEGAPEYAFGDIGEVRSMPGGGVLVTDRGAAAPRFGRGRPRHDYPDGGGGCAARDLEFG